MYILTRDSSTHPRTTTLIIAHQKQTTLSSHRKWYRTVYFMASYTDDHRGQLIADVISNSDHIT